MNDCFYHKKSRENLLSLKQALVFQSIQPFEHSNVCSSESQVKPFYSCKPPHVFIRCQPKKNSSIETKNDNENRIIEKSRPKAMKLTMAQSLECVSCIPNNATLRKYKKNAGGNNQDNDYGSAPKISVERIPPLPKNNSEFQGKLIHRQKKSSLFQRSENTKNMQHSNTSHLFNKNNKSSSIVSSRSSIKRCSIISFKRKLKLPKIKAKSWLIYDNITEKILFSKKSRKSREIASLTKIMTCYLSCYYIEKYSINPEKYYIKVPKSAAILGGTSANLESGDNLSIKDLLYGLMLPSGNDAAYCLANFFGKLAYILYQEEKAKPFSTKKKKFNEIYQEKWNEEYLIRDFVKYFVCEMNKIARNEGLTNTIFNNPHGLADNLNKSCAEDIAKLSSLAIKSKIFTDISSSREYFCHIVKKNKEKREIYWKNKNELLDKGFSGIKTGNTPTAGPCLAASYNQNGLNLIFVVLKTKSDKSRFSDTMKLLKWFMKNRQENIQNMLFFDKT